MEKREKGDPPKRKGTSHEELANKYRVSWRQATEAQRQTLCSRLGLRYTSVDDEALLWDVAARQQSLYEQSRMSRQTEENPKDEKTIVLGLLAKHSKGDKRKARICLKSS